MYISDGRYKSKTGDLEQYFSEMSFNKYRILVEIEYLISLGKLEVYEDLDEPMTFLGIFIKILILMNV